MGISMVEKIESKEFSPKEIREMLGIDNSQIQELCKIADIKLKKNERGLTYFTQDDAKTLKDVSDNKMKYVTPVPSKNVIHKGTNSISNASIVSLVETLKSIEKSMTDKITGLLDEKLDGMDDVVMELIRVKTENETMRFKINELNKENYKLKKEINSFKKVPFGFYAKTTPDKLFEIN
ncbi:MAG: cobalamin biosynthesis protein, partial [Candidatus Gastranaerophilales bacterium]|nr:cobalamin biosynthesis protein [Candidatus Gastranaerophilales bacterium]